MPQFDEKNQPDYSTRRPRGKSGRTKILEALKRNKLNEEQFLDSLVVIAKNDEHPLQQFVIKEIFEGLMPKVKPVLPCVEIEFDKSGSAFDQCMQIIEAVTEGNVPSDISQSVIAQIKMSLDIKELTEVAERVEFLEKELGIEAK